MWACSMAFVCLYHSLVLAHFLTYSFFLSFFLVYLLACPCLLVTTPCILHHVKSLGDEFFGAYVASKRYEKRNCRHDEKNPKSPADCILDLVGQSNPFRYMIATQDETLLDTLRQVPGVPLIHIYRSVIILDPIPKICAQEKESLEFAKTRVSETEKKLIQALVPIDKPKKKLTVIRKRKAKQPNPLSVKKKAKPSPAAPRPPAAAKANDVC